MVTKDDDENVSLTNKINADLREKMNRTQNTDASTPDFAEDVDYLKDYKKTGHFSWIWLVLILLAAAALVVIVLL